MLPAYFFGPATTCLGCPQAYISQEGRNGQTPPCCFDVTLPTTLTPFLPLESQDGSHLATSPRMAQGSTRCINATTVQPADRHEARTTLPPSLSMLVSRELQRLGQHSAAEIEHFKQFETQTVQLDLPYCRAGVCHHEGCTHSPQQTQPSTQSV